MPKERKINSPPESWVKKQQDSGLSEEAIAHKWRYDLTRYQRRNAYRLPARRLACIERAKARVAAGATDQRTLTVAAGGYKMHDTAEEAEEARLAAIAAFNVRRSTKRLAHRLESATRCAVEGCVFASPDHPIGVSLIMRKDESALPLCLWHKYLELRVARGVQPNVTECRLEETRIQLARRKEQLGCQHPLHSLMPYAVMIPTATEDPLMYGFLDVSHKVRGKTTSKVDYVGLLRDLDDGCAVVHCKFCHRLYTICEYARYMDTPAVQHYYATLLRFFPAFVTHFDETTAGFDWDAERAKLIKSHSGPRRLRHSSSEQPKE